MNKKIISTIGLSLGLALTIGVGVSLARNDNIQMVRADGDTKTLDSITISHQPWKTAYHAGQVFSPTGMEITANYTDGTSKVVSDYTYSQEPVTSETTEMVISYEEGGITKTVAIPITVKVVNNVVGIAKMPPSFIYKEEIMPKKDIMLRVNFVDNSETEDVVPTRIELDTTTVGTGIQGIAYYDYATGEVIGSQFTIEVRYRGRYIKANYIQPGAASLLSNYYNLMNYSSSGQFSVEYQAGEFVEDRFFMNSGILWRDFHVKFQKINFGKYKGKYLIYNDSYYLDNTILYMFAYERNGTGYGSFDKEIRGDGSYFDVEVLENCQINIKSSDGYYLRFNGNKFAFYPSKTVNSPVWLLNNYAYSTSGSWLYLNNEEGEKGYIGDTISVGFTAENYKTVTVTHSGMDMDVVKNEELSQGFVHYYDVTFKEIGTGTLNINGYAAIPLECLPDSVDKLVLKSNPTKLTYDINEPLDLTGLKVDVYHESGNIEELDNSLLTVEGFDSTKAATHQEVTLSYDGKSVSIYVDIVPTVCGIELDTSKMTTNLYVGWDLDIANLDVYDVYTDGNKVLVSDFGVEGFDSSKPAESQTITVSRHGFTATFTIHIEAVVNERIEVVTGQTEYYQDHQFDWTGYEFYLIKNSGERVRLTSNLNFTSTSTHTPGDHTVTVTWDGDTSISGTFTYHVTAIVSQGIRIHSNPYKLTYFENEQLNTEGLVVEEYFNDGSTRTLASHEYTVYGNMILPDGVDEADKTFTVSRDNWDQTTTFEVHVIRVKETGIQIVSQPTKLEYWESEDLDLTGLAVKVNKNNGTTMDLSMDALTITGFTKGQVGEQTITVSYNGFAASFTVTVKAVYIVSIEVTSLPDKVDYYVGEEINLEGIEVKATYSDGDVKPISITEENLEDLDMSTAGEVTVTVKVGDVTTTFKINVNNVPTPKKGCGGSIAATSALLSLVATSGIALLTLKKRKQK